MREILNPYDIRGNMCFGCSQSNPLGLRLKFMESAEFVHATWNPDRYYEGYPNILHGGIISALLDEIGAWCISVKAGTAGVTTEINIKYILPVYINKGEISLQASIIEHVEKNAKVKCQLFNSQSKLCAEALVNFFLYPVEVAKSRFRYPGKDAFHADI